MRFEPAFFNKMCKIMNGPQYLAEQCKLLSYVFKHILRLHGTTAARLFLVVCSLCSVGFLF